MFFLSIIKSMSSSSTDLEEYKQKSLDFSNKVEKWFDKEKRKKKGSFENDDDYIEIEGSPTHFTYEETFTYAEIEDGKMSDNSFTSSSDEGEIKYKIIQPVRIDSTSLRREPKS